MKKILIALVFSLGIMHSTFASNLQLESLITEIEHKPLLDQKKIYSKYIKKLDFSLSTQKYKKYHNNIVYVKNIFIDQLNEVQEKIDKNKSSIQSHNTLILKFNNWMNIDNYIEKNKSKIQDTQSVFLFREKHNISSKKMKIITSQLKIINPNILIFIDQEGGFINRFVSFEGGFSMKNYESDPFIFQRYNFLTAPEKITVSELFGKKYYFPSMKNIWKSYKKISKENKKNFLEIVTYIQLKNLQNHWINTHGIIGDLDLWNPVISWLSRSFSDNVLDYFHLIDAYMVASEQTQMFLYLKHFPWHGSGKVDSHKWILDYSHNTSYVKENLVVFEYFLWKKTNISRWIMVGHMFLDKNISDRFHEILGKSDFIITDDLAMRWYASVKNIPNEKIFTTKELDKYSNLIKVHTQINIWIK